MSSHPDDPPAARELHVHASSRGLDPERLRPGHDLVLDMPPSHGLRVPEGVFLEDHLEEADRAEIDAQALRALARWHERFDAAFAFGTFSLADVWHAELFPEVFLPTVRAVEGLRRIAAAGGLARLVTHGIDPELAAALRSALAPMEVVEREPGAVERYPGEDAAPKGTQRLAPSWRTLARRLLNLVGLPSLVRGELLVISYYSTEPILARLADGAGPRPVVFAPTAPRPDIAARAARRGGFTGLPGALALARARHRLEARVERVAAERPELLGSAGPDALLHARALRCLRLRATESLALGWLLERALRRGRIRSVLVPFDSVPEAKVLIRIAQAHGIPTLALQHGYEPRKSFHPGEITDHLGAWSHWDVDTLPPERRPRTRVVGNPSLDGARAAPRPVQARPHAVIIVEHPLRVTALIGRRITAQHLAVALEGLRRSRHDWRITVRPHPADDPDEFLALARELGDENVAVDPDTPILELLRSADACVGAVSTASIQTALTGTRLVMLMPERIDCVPPLDGSAGLLFARDAAELAERLDGALEAETLPGEADMLEALGASSPRPIDTILAWLDELASGQPQQGYSRPL